MTWNGVNYGYPLTVGWNRATGWGSINIGKLASYIQANPGLFQ
ncbi:MAG: hypothetical protein VB138_14065 [Burkholderia sp.]